MFPTLVSSPTRKTFANAQRGTTLLEVLVTIVILAIGLLGLAGLQTRLQASEMEAYQRAQALILLSDMANRIATNRANAASYLTGHENPLGGTDDCPTTAATRQQVDAGEWCNALKGAGETMGTSNIGAMVGGRGCVEVVPGAVNTYLITVAWQGLTPLEAPPDGVACGEGAYDGGTNCTDDACRRTVTTIVQIGNLAS